MESGLRIPMLRALAVAALSLLLVGMQVGALVHPYEHDAERLGRPDRAALLVPGADEVCAICASFAGGAHASPAPDPGFASDRPSTIRVAAEFASFAGAAPAYYQSRAPPALL